MEETWNGRFTKVHKTICQGGRYSPYFDYSDGFMAVQVCRNLTNCALQIYAVYCSSVTSAIFQSSVCVWLFVTPWTAAHKASLSLTISCNLPRFMSTISVMPSNHLILVSFFLQSFPASGYFQWIRRSKDWSFSLSVSSSIRYSRLISFKIAVVWSCCPRDSQESSPLPQFESINCLTLHLLYGSTLTSVHIYWKDHSLDYMDFCQQNDAFAS